MDLHAQIIAEFLSALKDKGLETTDPILGTGKIERFHVIGDKAGSLNGWCVLHIDERPAGSYGRWGGDKYTWAAHNNKKLTGKERKELERRITEHRRMRDEEEARLSALAAEKSLRIWEESTPAPADHQYLVNKKIKPHLARLSRGDLVIPLWNLQGELRSLQFISFGGAKKYLEDGEKSGSYCCLGTVDPESPTLKICIAEGFSTAASIYEATGYPVAIAFDTSNLAKVAGGLRKKYPRAELILCADNDCWKPEKGNGGVKYATEAAIAARGRLAVVQFLVGEGKPTDYNDLASREGLGRVKELIDAAVDPAPKTALVPVAMAPKEKAPPMVLPIGVEWPLTTGKDAKPTASIQNTEKLLEHCGIKVNYNVIRKDLEISIPNSTFLIDTARNDKMTLIISLASIARLPTSTIPEFVSFIGGQNPMNPVADWIHSKAWDKESRLAMFYATVIAVGEEMDDEVKNLKELLIKRWMVSAIAAALEPSGASTGGVLVFQGEQYSGKTAWFKSLVPRELELTMDGCILRPDDKDSVFQTVTKWLVELGEVDATFRKSDIAQLKAFLTKDRDMLRRPYARTESEFARRTVFFASVNPKDYLADPTGNRRFWTIPCANIIHNHGLDMQQVWAEFYELYKSGEPWRLTPDEMPLLNKHNKNFEAPDPMEERIRDAYNWEAKDDLWTPRTATAIAQGLGIGNPTAKDLKGVAKAVREITGAEGAKSNGKLVYRLPPKKSDMFV
ncbi:MAG: VapE domain-containing protein [Kiritimatiellia bacterium]